MSIINKCIVCNKIIEFLDINLKICGTSECEISSRTIYTNDNFIYDFVCLNKNEAYFILSMAKNAIDSDKYAIIYSPVPYFNNMNKDSTINNLKIVFNSMDIKNELENIVFMENDNNIYANIGPFKYGLLKYTFKSNLINLKKNDMFFIKSLKTYEVSHDQFEIEQFNQKIKKDGSSYLFHGSHKSNWYSILMNGLQIFSSTTRMTNGKAFGEGIYLSDSFEISKSYSIMRTTSDYNTFIVGVFEVIGDIAQYKKSHNIYVINDISKLRIKYILWNESKKLTVEESTNISNKFGRIIIKEKIEKKKYYNNMTNKRLMMEAINVSKIDTESLGLRFEINEENMYIWKVFINKIDEKSELYKDMIKMKVEHIEMEIRFEQQYPISPPFVRVVSPVFKYRSANITLGGSICMELLTTQEWSPIYSMESLMVHIKSQIIEGEGRLDLTKKGVKYTYEDAKSAFQRMLLSHNWK